MATPCHTPMMKGQNASWDSSSRPGSPTLLPLYGRPPPTAVLAGPGMVACTVSLDSKMTINDYTIVHRFEI
jgi:hypothetical protein